MNQQEILRARSYVISHSRALGFSGRELRLEPKYIYFTDIAEQAWRDGQAMRKIASVHYAEYRRNIAERTAKAKKRSLLARLLFWRAK